MKSYSYKHLGFRILYLILAVFLVNLAAMKFFWYYTMWWFDIPMHFAGGLFLGLLFAYIWLRIGNIKWNTKDFIYGILFVFIVGALWEVFEFNIDTFVTFSPQNILDTLSDMCFDLAGGVLALRYVQKYIPVSKDQNKEDGNSI